MKLTRREKHILVAAAIIALFFIITHPDQATAEKWEYFYILLIALPLGMYLVTDPERRKDKEHE
jgi:NAD/NADP transhydrogenase beta subunit